MNEELLENTIFQHMYEVLDMAMAGYYTSVSQWTRAFNEANKSCSAELLQLIRRETVVKGTEQ